jgi:hypothetical protein
MSISPPTDSALPVASRPARRSDARFLLVWTILVGGVVVLGATSTVLSQGQWFVLLMFIYVGPYKIAALIVLTSAERPSSSGSACSRGRSSPRMCHPARNPVRPGAASCST